jgi:hypothetical protein
MASASSLEPRHQIIRESRAPVHVPQSAALERGHHVLGIGDDQLAGFGRTGLFEYQLVVELRPHRHHQVAQARQPRRADRVPRKLAGYTSRCQLFGLLSGNGQNRARRARNGIVSWPRLEVFLVNLGAGGQPVPEQIREHRASTAAARGRMRVQVSKERNIDERPGNCQTLEAVAGRKNTRAQRENASRQPPGKAHQR